MDVNTIFRSLKNAGFNVLGSDSAYIHLEDPSCILRSFETFLDYAWIAITFVTGILLFGWAIAYIRGSKFDSFFINLRNLTLIFGILTAIKPIVNLVWGGDLFARGCRVIKISIPEVQRILEARNLTMTARNANDLYEEFNIYDSGTMGALEMPNELPYSQNPVVAAGEPQQISVEVTDGASIYPTRPNDTRPSLSPTFASGAASLATEDGNEIIYTLRDGTKIRKIGGSRAWRNNNPGNIINSKFAREHGAIGVGGRFAVFPDEETGMNAIKALLRTKNYASLTVGGAISRYAPPNENDTAKYQTKLEQLTGISVNTPMASLNDAQLSRVANAIRQIEGWKPGREER